MTDFENLSGTNTSAPSQKVKYLVILVGERSDLRSNVNFGSHSFIVICECKINDTIYSISFLLCCV